MLGSLATFRRKLLAWYQAHRREMPWRSPIGKLPDAWGVLVSEQMLQQTQVAVVIPYFLRFLERFPTPQSLAIAPLDDVLKLWQGLGYYSRARNLQKAAQLIVEAHDGVVPNTREALLRLPGVGPYTAGAVASLAYETHAPILDGNVMRVLCRLDAIRDDPRTPAATALLWDRAFELVPKSRPGDFNSAVMELGATICVPRSPSCLLCPVREHCEAQSLSIQTEIPPPKKQLARPLEERFVLCLRRGEHYAFEQRPATGRWAGMWQLLTRNSRDELDTLTGSPILSLDVPVEVGLTHREYRFHLFTARDDASSVDARWVTLLESQSLAVTRPHLKVIERLSSSGIDRASR